LSIDLWDRWIVVTLIVRREGEGSLYIGGERSNGSLIKYYELAVVHCVRLR
jgi:hypothetical protein